MARDPRLGREVAVKVVPDEVPTEDEREPLEEHLREEGQRAASLSHPHLAALLDAGEDDVHGPFLVFEHVAAPTLRERLAQGPSSSTQVARLARELGGALTHVHDAGLVHRNVNPSSIRLAETGAKLVDFDLLAPPGTDADAQTDEFALAHTLYEALTGRPRVAGHDGSVDPRVQAVFSRAFHRDTAQRFLSCRAFGEALAQAIQDTPVLLQSLPLQSLPPDSSAPLRMSTVPRATRKTQNMLAGGALAVILLLFFYGRPPPADPVVSVKKPGTDSHDVTPPRSHDRAREHATSSRTPSDAGPVDENAAVRD